MIFKVAGDGNLNTDGAATISEGDESDSVVTFLLRVANFVSLKEERATSH